MNGPAEAIDATAIRTALSQARQAAVQIDAFALAHARMVRTLETALKDRFNGPLNAPSMPFESMERRTKVRSRIAGDTELRTFILSRIMTLTFAQVIAEVVLHFPAERCPSRSALHRWWHREGKLLIDSPTSKS